MRGVEGGSGKRPFNYFNGRFPPLFTPPPPCMLCGEWRGAVKIAKPLSNFHNNPSSPSISPPLSWPLGPRERRSGAPHPPPPSNSSSWTGGCEGARQRMVRQTPPPSQRRGGGVRWKVEGGGERGAASPPLPHSPPPPNPFIFYRRSTGLGGRSSDPPSFHNMGIPPPNIKQRGDPQVWKEGGEREEGTVNAPLVFKNFHF
nr:hypothetical protein [Morchella crassipes]